MYVYLCLLFEDGFEYKTPEKIEKNCYDSYFVADRLISKHGNITHFYLILET